MVVLATAGREASAHRLDELLQAARIDVHPDRARIELDLTPGSRMAGELSSVIDHDGDTVWSAAERLAFADRVAAQVILKVDGQPIVARVVTVKFPDQTRLTDGNGTIALVLSAEWLPLAQGSHRFYFRNQNGDLTSSYLANALVPEDDAVSVGAQRRDGDQRELSIDFTVAHAAPRQADAWWNLVASAGCSVAFVLIVVARMPKLTRARARPTLYG